MSWLLRDSLSKLMSHSQKELILLAEYCVKFVLDIMPFSEVTSPGMRGCNSV